MRASIETITPNLAIILVEWLLLNSGELGNEKWSKPKGFKFDNDSFSYEILKTTFEKLLELLIENHYIKQNIRDLSLEPKEDEEMMKLQKIKTWRKILETLK